VRPETMRELARRDEEGLMLASGYWWGKVDHGRCVRLGKVVGRRRMGRPAGVGRARNTLVLLAERTRSDSSEIGHLHACKHGAGCTFCEVAKIRNAIYLSTTWRVISRW